MHKNFFQIFFLNLNKPNQCWTIDHNIVAFQKWLHFVDVVCITSFDRYSGVNVYVP